jgi:hypothetical protein
MRTSIDIPESLFHQIEANAAMKGVTPENWILRAVRAKLCSENKATGSGRIELPIVQSKEAYYDVSPDRLSEILQQEDCGSSD